VSNVIQFPSRALRNWERFRPAIEDVLSKSGMGSAGIEAVTERMKQAWLSYDHDYSITFTLPLPESVPAEQRQDIMDAVTQGLTEFERKVQSIMNQVMLDRLKLEIELYFAQDTTT